MHWLFAEVSLFKEYDRCHVSQIQNVKESSYSRSLLFGPQTALAYAWKQMTQENSLQIIVFWLCITLKQKQVAYIMQEYNDALQRAERLSVARENFLMGKNNPSNLVTQEDLTIYTKWLVCHLHSLRTIHHYLQVCET